jgi:small-conductance mechanosensitive channel
MDSRLWHAVTEWLFDPTVGKFVAIVAGIVIISVLTRTIRRVLLGHIESTDTRYRLRKLVNAAGTLAAIILITVVFSDKLGNLTVAFGVAGAGIAFALQEVIASVAGWVAVSFGNFYSVGDRVQLGGISGDVIDIGVLRTTLMETGQWVKADLYNGRIVKVANSFVFKEPVFNYSGDFPFL